MRARSIGRRGRSGRPRRVPAAAVLVLAASLVAGCGDGGAEPVAYAAADLRSGEATSVEALRGRPVVLVSWATWCRECDEELAGLRSFSESEDAEGLEVVAVNIDAADVDDEIDAKLERAGLDVTLWRDRRNDFKRSFRALGVPTTVLLDADGRVAGTFPGAVDFDATEVLAALDEVRAEA